MALGAWRPGRVEAAPAFDLLIDGGTVLDGTGAPAFVAGVAVKGDTIAAVGDVAPTQAAKVVQAQGLHVCPGFVDMHSHSDGRHPRLSGSREPSAARHHHGDHRQLRWLGRAPRRRGRRGRAAVRRRWMG